MHIAVLLRLVPDLAEELEVAEGGADIDREWIGIKLNEFDDHALEEAILLKERGGASVTAVILDGEGADRQLQSAIARGADRAVKVSHELPALAPANAVAALLARAVTELGADLVLTGVQTPEDLSGQLAPWLGATLGWPHVSAVSGTAAADGGLAVRQEHSGGYAVRLQVALPAVLGVQTASAPPRYVSGSKLRQAMGAKLETLEVEAGEEGRAATLRALAKPERSGGATLWEGDADAVAEQFVALLRERGLLKG
jgi:electron transfer flavoprotein beta subunit